MQGSSFCFSSWCCCCVFALVLLIFFVVLLLYKVLGSRFLRLWARDGGKVGVLVQSVGLWGLYLKIKRGYGCMVAVLFAFCNYHKSWFVSLTDSSGGRNHRCAVAWCENHRYV